MNINIIFRAILVLFAITATFSYAQNQNASGNIRVEGVVTAEKDGQPLAGVSISVRDKFKGVLTDLDGKFEITVTKGDVLLFSFIGFETEERVITEEKSTPPINVVMREGTQNLNEVVVTSLGVERQKKTLGYSTVTVDTKELVKTGTTNFATALYGKAAGVRIEGGTGGSTSPVNIQIRGVNSLTGKSQPLIILDGVPIRNEEVINNNYWQDQRIRGNGLLDLNPEDIENISVLKGASAAALYGSEAVNGVVLITTKKGTRKKGLGIDFSTNQFFDTIAYLPRFQNERGPGVPKYLFDLGQAADNFVYEDLDSDGIYETRRAQGTSLSYGPYFDGQPALVWDGKQRPYRAQADNYASFFRKYGYSNSYNVSVSRATDNFNLRFSYTRQDNQGISLRADQYKNIFNLNTTFKQTESLRTDVMANFINQTIENRPISIDRLFNNFGGMITRFDDAAWYLDRYQTSLGYKYQTGANPSLTPKENLIYNSQKNAILDYFWQIQKQNYLEQNNRLIASITQYWQVYKDLSVRGRVSTDYTVSKITQENYAEQSLLLVPASGGFSMRNNNNNILYLDFLLTYIKSLSQDLKLTVVAGYNSKQEINYNTGASDNGGLTVENKFDVAFTRNQATATGERNYFLRDAFLGTASLGYKDYLFLEGSIRRDRTSTMNPKNNSYTYPSFNASFVFSEAFKMPEAITKGKLRLAWGMVGNFPDMYKANISYNYNTLGAQGPEGKPVSYTKMPQEYGNDNIRAEIKYETEIGTEMAFLKDRLSVDLSYYDARITDQILPITTPSTIGTTTVLSNVGTLRNRGVDLAIRAEAIKYKNFRWDVGLNLSRNFNMIEKLALGQEELVHSTGDGGAYKLVSREGSQIGDFYVPSYVLKDGQKMVNSEGFYELDKTGKEWTKVGNAMPLFTGGLLNSFTYKDFTLSTTIDFRIGGDVMPTGLGWMKGRGLLEESLNNSTKERGGFAWYEASDGNRHQTNEQLGPNGEKVYNDGIILPGVKADGTPNDKIISSTEYYFNVYNWGGPQYGNADYRLFVSDNTYFKMREISLAYSLPRHLVSKVGIQNFTVSVFARNMFFLYRSIKDLDPEQLTSGSRWYQNVSNVGTNPATRTVGISLRASF